jgi:hypothetical protein
MSKQNGSAPRIQRREKWLDLPDEYAGFKIKVWINAPTKLWNDILYAEEYDETNDSEAETDRKTDIVFNALKQIVLEHNGWLDFDGNPIPAANTIEFWDTIPTELSACIIAAVQRGAYDLPNSMRPQRRKSRSGSRRQTKRG